MSSYLCTRDDRRGSQEEGAGLIHREVAGERLMNDLTIDSCAHQYDMPKVSSGTHSTVPIITDENFPSTRADAHLSAKVRLSQHPMTEV